MCLEAPLSATGLYSPLRMCIGFYACTGLWVHGHPERTVLGCAMTRALSLKPETSAVQHFTIWVPEVVVRPTSRHKNLTECNLTSFPLKELTGLNESVKLKFKINGQQNAIYISTSFFVLSPISKHATTLLLELDRVK